jgi:hypothetical protein
MKLAIVSVIAAAILLGILVYTSISNVPDATKSYYSIQERRLPCGRILRREVVEENDAWRKTVTLLDPSGAILATKTHTVEPEHCNQIRAGNFVPNLWRDCQIPL